MRYKYLILILIPIVIYTIYFLKINNEENNRLPPSIIVKITPTEFITNTQSGNNIISLLIKEMKIKNLKNKPIILLNARNDVSYTKVKKTIEKLKTNGYNHVSFTDKE